MIINFIEKQEEFNPDTNDFDWYSRQSYLVDTDKIVAFRIDNDHEYRYVENIINEAIIKGTGSDHSKKYSFSDCPAWYNGLYAPAGTSADLVIEYFID